MEFGVLGPLEVRDDNVVVEVRQGIPRLVLIALLVRAGEVAAPEWLWDVIWGEEQPRLPANALQRQMSYLRRVLASGPSRSHPIITRSGGYVLEAAPDAVDATRFLRAHERAQRHLDVGTTGALEAALIDLDDALGLWRGTALVEALDRHFALAASQRFEEARLCAAETRLDCLLALGRHLDAAMDAVSLATQHPLRERFHEQLMIALYRGGRQADALRAYERARTTLRQELGLDPGPSLQQTARLVLDQSSELDWVSPPTTLAIGGQTSTQGTGALPDGLTGGLTGGHDLSSLPQRMTPLVGREAELDRLRAAAARSRLVTLTGSGGTGKTTLCVELARTTAGESRVWFVDLDSIDRDELVASHVAAALGVTTAPDHDPVARIATHLGVSPTLLVLDTCEHVVDGAASTVSALLHACPDLHVLATSRRPLAIRGELVWPVPPLALASEGASFSDLAAAPATELFVQRATAARPDFVLTERNGPAVAAICRSLDGLPLALELAAARVDTLSPAAIRDRLSDRFSLLIDGGRDAAGRHQTLRATIDWSTDLLTADERRMFTRLAVFAGPFSLDQAVAIDGQGDDVSIRALTGLVRQSLVAASSDDQYQLLDTPRDYARELLERDPYRDEVHELHARLFLDFASAAADGMWSRRRPEFITLTLKALPDLRASIDWAFAHHQEEAGARTIAALAWFFMLDGRIGQGLELFRRADDASGNLSLHTRARIAYGICLLSAPLGQLDEAKVAGDRSCRLARQSGDGHTLAEALAALSVAEWGLGAIDDAIEHQDAAIELYRSWGDPWRQADILALRARSAVDADDPHAPRLLDEVITLARSIGDHHAAGLALTQQSNLAMAVDDHETAARHAREALAAHELLDEPEGTIGALHLLGQAQRALGNTGEAEALHHRALDMAYSIGHLAALCEAVEDLAAVAADRGEPTDAARLLVAADEQRSHHGLRRRPVDEARVAALRASLERTLHRLPDPGAVPFFVLLDELRSRDDATGDP